ncbi:hypothetical protein ACOMHN_013352 [Nucella lapillus]
MVKERLNRMVVTCSLLCPILVLGTVAMPLQRSGFYSPFGSFKTSGSRGWDRKDDQESALKPGNNDIAEAEKYLEHFGYLDDLKPDEMVHNAPSTAHAIE